MTPTGGDGQTTPRTLWVTNDFPPRAGGVEQFIANLCDHLDPGSVRVVTASPRQDPAETSGHDRQRLYPVDRLTRRILLPEPGLLRTVRRAAAAHEADVVVFGASWPLGALAPHLAPPTFALSHGHEAGMARVGLAPLVRRGLRGLDGIGVVSAYTRAALADAVPADVAVHDLPPGVDVDRFHPGIDGGAYRRGLGLTRDQPLVVCVSRLVRRKGQDALVEAWPEVGARVPGAHLLLVGGGPLERRLRQRARRLGLDGAVTLLGEVEAAAVPGLHAAADVFAMPARTRWAGLDVEGLGIVYLEAQASGVPVVAGRSGGAPETVLAGETGVVVDGDDPEDVARAIVGLLAEPERRAQMGRAGRRHVEERWTWPVVAGRFASILRSLAARDRPA